MSRAYAKAGRIKEAYDALREASRLEPAVAEHYIDLAMLCLEHENYDLGLEIVDVGLKHRPDSSMLYLQRGVVLAMKGAIEQAEKEFDRASRAAPDDPAPVRRAGDDVDAEGPDAEGRGSAARAHAHRQASRRALLRARHGAPPLRRGARR